MMQPVNIFAALDPSRSATVDANAGTGKTWLLVSRIIRVLLEGVPPHQLLAITFTRKAAAEMQERLQQWCRELAFQDDSWVKEFLLQRGITPSQLDSYVPRARDLYELISFQGSVKIQTFDEWFLAQIRQAPLSSGIPMDVTPGPDRWAVRQEAWLSLLNRASLEEESALAQLVLELGSDSVKALLFEAAQWRNEWQLFKSQLNVTELWNKALSLPDVVADFHAQAPELLSLGRELCSHLIQAGASQQKQGAELEILLQQKDGFLKLLNWTFTEQGLAHPRLNLGKALDKLGLMPLWQQWVDRLETLREQWRQKYTAQLNKNLYVCIEDYFAELKRIKTQRQEADFSDIALWVYQLLCDPMESPHWLCRLDGRFQQVLVDEFQDTSPIQWHILRQWFVNAKQSSSDLTVFIVGDPKQAIYRFRHADSRIFKEARTLLQEEFHAVAFNLEQSYRSHEAIIQLINGFFKQKTVFASVNHRPKPHPHRGVVKLCLMAPEGVSLKKDSSTGEALRHPLKEAKVSNKVVVQEALHLAQRLKSWVGNRVIMTAQGERTLAYGDILLLSRRRQTFEPFEEALRQQDIPFVSQQRGQLLFYLEIEDLLALLRVLAYPMDNLSLAHCLKAPFFACDENDLLSLAKEPIWWDAITHAEHPLYERVGQWLLHWQPLSQYLPPHDLLEVVFAQGNLLAAYQRTLPHHRFLQAKANLEAFLAFSLNYNGGRYPNLVRFLDEMEELKKEESEAPDQGALAAGVDAVRFMTIHGAKGLEAPMVWLVDNENPRASGQSHSWFVNWSPELAYPDYFAYIPTKNMIPQSQQWRLDEEKQILEQEETHLLYVALTRAQSELYILGSEGDNQSPWVRELSIFSQENPDVLPLEIWPTE